MNIFTRKNALVGFAALKLLERRRRRRRNRARLALAAALGIVSLGMLAGLAVLLYRRQHAEPSFGEQAIAETEDEIVGEVVAASPEPIPAT